MAPRDEAMLVHMLHTALQHDAARSAIRYPRGEARRRRAARRSRELLEIGTGEILREGERVALVGYGTGVGKALGAADLLAEGGLDVTVADARFAKPLDTGAARPARRRARPARHGRGGRAGRRLRHRRVGVAVRGRRWRRASCASACPTATSPTARRSCCTRRSASRAERIAERIEAAVLDPRGSLASA